MTALRTIILVAAACVAVLCFKVYSAGRELVTFRDARPRIATIDFYGLQHVTVSQLKAKLRLQVGNTAPVVFQYQPDLFTRLAGFLLGINTSQALESKLHEIPGVRDAAIAVVQAEDPHRGALFVGISEDSAVPARRAFHGNAVLPEAVASLYDRHSEAFGSAVANPSPDFDEDDSRGYSLFTDPAMRALEESAIAFAQAPQNRAAALTVLRTSTDMQQRRGAAWLLSYGPDPQQTANAMLDALDDPDNDVRNTVCRELAVLADYGLKHPALKVRIAPDPFIQMLNSVIWTDRDKAMAVLDPLTAARDSDTLMLLKRSGLASLDEMARWDADSYARMAFTLIGRIAALADADIQRTWDDGKAARERVILMATTQSAR
jgi:hypothetical protein